MKTSLDRILGPPSRVVDSKKQTMSKELMNVLLQYVE